MNKKKRKYGKVTVEDDKAQVSEQEQHDSPIQETDDDSIEVNDPSECIGH